MSRKKKVVAPPGLDSSPKVTACGVPVASDPPLAKALTEASFAVVGIGASAGGLKAFEAFFSGMPTDRDPDMAFVLVQHLAPDHESTLTELVQRHTRMQVFEVEDGMEVHPNCTYIIPPNRDMTLSDGVLHLAEPSAARGRRLPIDLFFRSLAQSRHERAIGIVLSGTGSDGALGIRAIKGEGGMVMVQTPESAEYDGMPRTAIATGVVDFQLSPEEMPPRLMLYAAQELGRPPIGFIDRPSDGEPAFQRILTLLQTQTGHDFSRYKPSTVRRRVERRMAVHQLETVDMYVAYLIKTPNEVEALFRDLLIGVTRFFRDPDAYAALEQQIIPKVCEGAPNRVIRVWSAGCSTGEEAYSLAMLLAERQDMLKQDFQVQIFATDIDSQAIAVARAAIYPGSIAADLPPDRLARHFATVDESSLRVRKRIRDMVVFSEQDVIRDPPFSRLDLISCRNLMIYLDGEAQKRLIALFHYALKPGGFLFLGMSETVGEYGNLFTSVDRNVRLYQRLPESLARRMIPWTILPSQAKVNEAVNPVGAAQPTNGKRPLRSLTEQALLQHVSAVAALVDPQGDILYFHGRTGFYLEPTPGESGVNNVCRMARPGLQHELRTALRKIVSDSKSVHIPGLRVRSNGDTTIVDLSIHPVMTGETPGGMQPPLYLVVLEPGRPEAASLTSSTDQVQQQTSSEKEDAGAEARIAELQRELRSKEDYLESINDELETSNEELTSANEELQSLNEELQSTVEELETSKEELQSLNEELTTVNAELQDKVTALSQANNDVNNLLAGTNIGTVFVDHDLRILRFTPTVTSLINLIPSDIGRPVGHIVPNLEGYKNLIEDTQAVLDTLVPKKVEVRTARGTWHRMSIEPYRTIDNVIEGAVITFVDITDLKAAEESLQDARVFAESIIATIRKPLLVLDGDLRVVLASAAFYRDFEASEKETVGRILFDLGPGRWDSPRLRSLVEELVLNQAHFDDYEVAYDGKAGSRTLLLNAHPIARPMGKPEFFLLMIEDITAREHTRKG